MNTETVPSTPPFKLSMMPAFSTFTGGKPQSIPYLIDGLLPSGAFSILAGKPKRGKSSLSRYEAVCVMKGQPFLGRETSRGEVMLITLEDPASHVDNCLSALNYDVATDAPIHIVTKLSPRIDDSIAAIDDELSKHPNIRLVIVDTLAKLLRADDLNDYSKVLHGVEKVSSLARKHPHVHIQGLAHAKKLKTDDPFDSLLGSTALRGEPDTTIVLYDDRGQRVIASETRIGRSIPPTLLEPCMVESAGASVVAGYSLGVLFETWQRDRSNKTEHRYEATLEERIITFVRQSEGLHAAHASILAEVTGKTDRKLEAISNLVDKGVLTASGTKRSRTTPLVLHLNESVLQANDFVNKFGPVDGGTDDAD